MRVLVLQINEAISSKFKPMNSKPAKKQRTTPPINHFLQPKLSKIKSSIKKAYLIA